MGRTERSKTCCQTQIMASRIVVTLRTGAIIAVGAHVGITVASIAYATGRLGGANAELLLRDDGKGPRDEAQNSHHFQIITDLVTNMYAGRGLEHELAELDDSVTFADPAAICRGPSEVSEAFRALRYLNPQSLMKPRCVHIEPKGASIILTYILYQRYMGWLSLPSLLVVDVQLKQRPDMPQSGFLVLGLEEQWNGVPLLTTYLNQMVRRLNGIASYRLTRQFLS